MKKVRVILSPETEKDAVFNKKSEHQPPRDTSGNQHYLIKTPRVSIMVNTGGMI